MGISNYLTNLLAEGVKISYFNLLPLKNLDKSCCLTANTEAIDFDAIKERIRNEKGTHSLKSCDGLKIIPDHERIDFIEMKGMKKMVHHSKHEGDVHRLDAEVKAKMNDFNFLGKILDSLAILDFLVRLNEFTFNDPERRHYLNTKKYFIILTDVDPLENAIEFIALNLAYLAAFSTSIERQIHQTFTNEIDSLPTEIAANFQKPLLKNCNEIDSYYLAL